MKNSIFILAMLIAFATVSCKKRKGCTDSQATNYSIDAKVDDGTCTYSGDISFWFNEATSSVLIDDGVEELTVYFDDVEVGTIDPAEWAIGPECFGDNRFTVTVDLEGNKSRNIGYTMNNQTGGTKFSGTVSATAGECNSTKLP